MTLIRNGACIIAAYLYAQIACAETFYVSKTGDDTNAGTLEAPFKRINSAAKIAVPGDTIIVGGGVYREWVDPARGGTSEENRITYKAEEGETVIISGSELITGWEKEGALWKVDIQDDSFGSFNPYKETIRHPNYVEEDEAGDGWGWLKYGRWVHRGDVVFKGRGFTERETLEELTEPHQWHTQTKNGVTTIWAHFGEQDPNTFGAEISFRPYGFFPSKAGLNYITVSDFIVANIATHWAPPTEYQPGAIGPNGGHHWVINDNAVIRSRAVGISIGLPTGKASETQAGSHTISNNVLLQNGQAGIAGQSWNHDTLITGNWIEDTNVREEFGGWETAAIKIHNADNVLIKGNVIRTVRTQDPEIGAAHGVWVDYENKNVRVTGNLIANVEASSILTEANWNGPNVYDQNIVFGGEVGTYSSKGDLWLSNLFVHTKPRWIDQDWGDRVKIGNSRWIRNVFSGNGLEELPEQNSQTIVSDNLYFNGAGSTPRSAHEKLADYPGKFWLEWTDQFNGFVRAKLNEADRAALMDIHSPLALTSPALSAFDPQPKRTALNPFSFIDDFSGDARSGKGVRYGPDSELFEGVSVEFGGRVDAVRARAIQKVLRNGIAAFE